LIDLESAGDVVRGNFLGLRADGTVPALSATGGDGLLIRGANAIVGGLGAGQGNVISGNRGRGIEVAGPGAVSARILGNIIGLDPTGSSPRGNGSDGIAVELGASGEFIGPGNLISANRGAGIALLGTRSIVVAGNTIGTDATATRAIGNALDGIRVDLGSSGVTIGSPAAAGSDLISGNARAGVAIQGGSTGTVIQLDRIGTDGTGRFAIGNGIAGVLILDAPGNVVGPGDLISGNGSSTLGAGVWIGGPGSSGNVVVADRIGTDASGRSPLGNAAIGVLIDEAPRNTIGGTAIGSTNVISGNTAVGLRIAGLGATGNLVEGNLIGTDASGSLAIGNGSGIGGDGVSLANAPRNTIGGSVLGAANVVSGNGFDGILVFGPGSSGNLVQGNRVGTDVAGRRALGNGNHGIVVDGAPATAIVANLVAGNARGGIAVSGPGASGTLILGDVIGRGAGGQPLGNGAFGVVILNRAPRTTLVGNINVNNALGPVRVTNPAPVNRWTISTMPAQSPAKGKHRVKPQSPSFRSRPMPALQKLGKGHHAAKATP